MTFDVCFHVQFLHSYFTLSQVPRSECLRFVQAGFFRLNNQHYSTEEELSNNRSINCCPCQYFIIHFRSTSWRNISAPWRNVQCTVWLNCVRLTLQNYRQKKSRSFGGSSFDMPFEHRENNSPSQVAADSQRSESLPATPSDALHQPPLLQPIQYRYPGPGYWPMSYDMRMWAGLQMQHYMMDPRQSDHGHGEHYDFNHIY